MTDALNSTVPAGWYPDPWGSASQRWWDGSAWTENLHPQPEASPAAAEPSAEDENYTPVAVRSTYEAAPSYTEAPAPASPYPSRRAMRELAGASVVEQSGEQSAPPISDSVPSLSVEPANAVAPSLPPFTQAPEFSPEPVSALPPPVWTEPVGEPVIAAQPEPESEPDPEPEPAALVLTPTVAAAAVSPSAAPVAVEPATATAIADDGWAASLARWEDVETTSAPPDAVPIFGDAPPVSYSQRAMRYQPLHGRTSPVWLIVFIPLLQVASVFGSVFLFPGLLQFNAQVAAFVPTTDGMLALLSMRDWLLFAVLPLTLAFFLFTLILGFQDRARLRLLGHDRTASPWWIVLSPLVYLIVRSVRVRQATGRRGSGPLTTYICLYIAPALALIVAQTVTSALYGAIPA